MVWVVLILMGVLVALVIVLKDLLAGILNTMFFFIGEFFGGINRFNTLILKLIGCAIVITIGCVVLLRLYSWIHLETVMKACMVSIALLIAIMPIKNTFSAKRSFAGYSLRICGCAITLAIGSGVLLQLYSWGFLKTAIQVCIVGIVLVTVVMLIKAIFTSRS